jgi:hypothetical protein
VQSDIKLRFTESSGGMETSWELREHPGSVVLQSGGLYSGNEQVNESLPVTSNSCYDLTVYDASGGESLSGLVPCGCKYYISHHLINCLLLISYRWH